MKDIKKYNKSSHVSVKEARIKAKPSSKRPSAPKPIKITKKPESAHQN
ncbi:MAG: hypothetical protein GTO02_08485 [Candidatus Dadabacteria bacterium]|nr:hypothetical protein [Candidatus Dadabacteria bacterium]NIQ14424.1 hypothetical protein [Candidatus Dadabacteria bacterium]